MSLAWIATHRPVWQAGSRRVLGTDEDLLTLAVEAASAGLGDAPAGTVDRIVMVVSRPDVVNSAAQGVIRRALGISDPVPIELRLGGSVATLEALASSTPGTLVIAAEDGSAGAASGAAFIASEGMTLSSPDLVDRSLPMRVRHFDELATHRYDDARLERERGWRPALEELSGGSVATFLAGVPGKEVSRFGATVLPDTDVMDATAPFFVLAAMASAGRDGRLIAVDSALGCGVDVRNTGSARVAVSHRAPVAVADGPRFDTLVSEIPISLPAYERAFEARLGLQAAQCECGELSYPPRLLCLSCGEMDRTSSFPLPRTGSVYSVVTVHIKVPGMATPYARAVVELDGVPVRILMPVTDFRPVDSKIGDRGRLVLRRIATREGVPDYGYSFQPDEREGQPDMRERVAP